MKRSLEKELMDLPGNPAEVLEEDLKNLRLLNRYLGGYRSVLWGLERLLERKRSGGFSLLDVGAGGGDLPRAIVAWGRQRGFTVRVAALEPNPITAALARRQTLACREIFVVRGDGFRPPFLPSSFDFVFASQVLHHFSEPEIIELLRRWSGLARRAVLVSDLVRHPLAYWGIFFLTRIFTRNPMTRTDAPLSVRRAFTLAEWRELFQRAEIGRFRLFPFFPFRFLAVFPSKAPRHPPARAIDRRSRGRPSPADGNKKNEIRGSPPRPASFQFEARGATEGERERGCGRPITNGTTHGRNPSAAAESGLPEGAQSIGCGVITRPPRSSRGNPVTRFDVAIVGAGPAGSASAITLARRGFSVLLLDKQFFPREKLCGDFLHPITLPLLENLGVMEELRSLGPRKITAFRISLASGAQATSRFPAVNGRPSFGLGLRRKDLDYTLLKHAVALGAVVREGCQVRAVERLEGAWSLTAADKAAKERLEARLLIGADGRHSWVAHRLGLAQPNRYHHHGSVGLQLHLAGARGINNEVQIHLFPGGYAGLLALDDHTVNLCFTVRREQIQRALSVPALMQQNLCKNPFLAQALEPTEVVGRLRFTYPVYFPPRRSYGEGFLLVGDAARVTEPVTGEGVFFALKSGVLAASAAERAFRRGDFSAKQLSAYARACREAFAGRQRLNRLVQALIYRPFLLAPLIRLSAPTLLLRALCRDTPGKHQVLRGEKGEAAL